MAQDHPPQSWWHTIPGFLTAMAAIITAVAGLVVPLHQLGYLDKNKQPIPQDSTPTVPVPQPPAPVADESAPRKKTTPLPQPPPSPPSDELVSAPEDIPEWVPVYPFGEPKNLLLRQGAGSFSFDIDHSANQVQATYTAMLQAAGWMVARDYNGGYWTAGTSRNRQRFIATIADRKADKTYVAVSFLDDSLALSGPPSPPVEIPNWVPIYPGKVTRAYTRDNSGAFSITTTHSAHQVAGLYDAILRASGYKTITGYDASYFARGTAESPNRSIAATADRKGDITYVTVMFEREKAP